MKYWIPALAGVILGSALLPQRTQSVEIPLDALAPVRIGFVDLQRVFDTYPEKSFAEGDLLREIEKRKRELSRHQTDINVLQQQISADQAALTDAQKGLAVLVPVNTVPEPVVAPTALPVSVSTAALSTSSSTVKASSATIEDYPTDDPLAGLPGHESAQSANGAAPALPGMKDSTPKQTMLDLLANATGPMLLNTEAQTALAKRIADDKQRMDNEIALFKTFRTNAIADMKVLQTEKTYGVMSKIYAVLQVLARDENVMVVMDKAYVLYGEDAVDLSDKLIERLQSEPQG